MTLVEGFACAYDFEGYASGDSFPDKATESQTGQKLEARQKVVTDNSQTSGPSREFSLGEKVEVDEFKMERKKIILV